MLLLRLTLSVGLGWRGRTLCVNCRQLKEPRAPAVNGCDNKVAVSIKMQWVSALGNLAALLLRP
jgi:hypothetical protein